MIRWFILQIKNTANEVVKPDIKVSGVLSLINRALIVSDARNPVNTSDEKNQRSDRDSDGIDLDYAVAVEEASGNGIVVFLDFGQKKNQNAMNGFSGGQYTVIVTMYKHAIIDDAIAYLLSKGIKEIEKTNRKEDWGDDGLTHLNGSSMDSIANLSRKKHPPNKFSSRTWTTTGTSLRISRQRAPNHRSECHWNLCAHNKVRCRRIWFPIMAITHIDEHTGNVVDVDIKDVVHSINGRGYGYFETKEKKQAWPNWPIGESPLLTSTISIAQLIDEVNISFKSVLSKNVLNRLNGTTDTKGVYTGKTLFSLKDEDAQSEKYTIPGYMYPARLNNALTRDEFRLLRENLVNKLQTEYTDSEHQTRNLIVPITYHGDDTKIVILDADSYAISDIYRVATWAYDGRIADLINRFERVIIKNGRHDFDKWMESFSGIRGTRICWKYVGHRFGNFDADLRAEASRRGVEPSQLLEGWSERGRLSENGGEIPGGSEQIRRSLKDVDAQSEKYTIPGYMYPTRLNNALTRNEFRLLRENLVNKLQTEYTDSEHQTRNLIVPITYHGDDTKIVILDADSYAISDIYRVAAWAYDGRIADLINRFERVIIKNGRSYLDEWLESFCRDGGQRLYYQFKSRRFGNFDADLRAEASRRGVELSQLLEGWSERGRLSENGGEIPGGSFSDRNLTGILTDRSMLYGVEDSFKAGWTIFARRKPNFASYRTHLGNAVKAEQADLHPDINVKVEDFPNLCGKRPAKLMDWV